MHPTFSISSKPATRMLLSKFPPLSFRIDEFSLCLSRSSGDSTGAPNGIIGPLNDSSNLRSYGVFPSARRSWTFRRLQLLSIECDNHLSFNPDCNNTSDVPSFTRRIARSAIPCF